jgi:hypothetical protein
MVPSNWGLGASMAHSPSTSGHSTPYRRPHTRDAQLSCRASRIVEETCNCLWLQGHRHVFRTSYVPPKLTWAELVFCIHLSVVFQRRTSPSSRQQNRQKVFLYEGSPNPRWEGTQTNLLTGAMLGRIRNITFCGTAKISAGAFLFCKHLLDIVSHYQFHRFDGNSRRRPIMR